MSSASPFVLHLRRWILLHAVAVGSYIYIYICKCGSVYRALNMTYMKNYRLLMGWGQDPKDPELQTYHCYCFSFKLLRRAQSTRRFGPWLFLSLHRCARGKGGGRL